MEPSLTRRMWKSQTVAENQTFSLCRPKSFGRCQIVLKYLCLRGNEAASPRRPPTVAVPPADRLAAPQSEEPSAEPPTWSETPPHSAILTTTLKPIKLHPESSMADQLAAQRHHRPAHESMNQRRCWVPLTCAEVCVCDAQQGVDQRVDPQAPQGGVGEVIQVLWRVNV